MLKFFVLTLFAYVGFAQSVDNLKLTTKAEFAHNERFATVSKAGLAQLDKSNFAKTISLVQNETALLDNEGEISNLTELKTYSVSSLVPHTSKIAKINANEFKSISKDGINRVLRCPDETKAIF
jgi:hypothetical protein